MPDKHYKCKYLSHGLDFRPGTIFHCCQSSHTKGKRTPLVENFYHEDIDWEKLFSIKNEMSTRLYNGDIPQGCIGCSYVQEVKDREPLSLDNYIDIVEINHFKKCNSSCIYCAERTREENLSYSILSIFKDMFERKILRDSGYIVFGGGEPTLLEGFDELLNLCNKNGLSHYLIHSSGIKYSSAIAECLKDKDLSIVISIDSGTKEIYKKVKMVDCFEKVCENVKKYILSCDENRWKVRLKYIIIPDVNDNLEEINKWYELCTRDLGVTVLFLDIEKEWFHENKENLPEYIINLIRHVKKRAEEDGVSLNYYERALMIESEI